MLELTFSAMTYLRSRLTDENMKTLSYIHIWRHSD